MKKVSLFLFVFLVGIAFNGFSQTTTSTTTTPTTTTTSTDFFAGKWEITITGTPNGDAKMVTDLIRKDGKLTGELKDPTGTNPVTLITKVEEEPGKKITIYFDTAQAGEIGVELAKVDDDHLKGQLMNMFDSTAVRIK
ncbi:hypothetical protein [Spirosoma arcticum]